MAVGTRIWVGGLAGSSDGGALRAGNIRGIGAWLSGPARVAFAIGLDCYLPPAFGRMHPRWKTPYVAILTQAVLATVFICYRLWGRGLR